MTTLYHGNFPALQTQFIRDVRVLRAPDPLAPLIVLVSGQLLRLHLRRELARAGVPWLNIQFLTLREFAHQLAAPAQREGGLQPLPDIAMDAFLLNAIRQAAPRLNLLREIARKAGFRRALWKTVTELRLAGLDAQALADSVRASRSTARVAMVAELAVICGYLENSLRQQRFVDYADLLRLAARQANPLTTPILIYGHDELAPLERALISQVPAALLRAAYIPYVAHADYAWSRALFEWFFARATKTVALEPTDAAHTALEQMQRGLSESAGAMVAEPDESVLIISAPTREREAEEAVREIFYAAEQNAAAPTVGILLRSTSAYVPLLRAQLAEAGLRGYLHQCITLAETPLGRGLIAWLALLDGEFRAESVIDFLAVAPLRARLPVGKIELTMAPTLWIHFARQAGAHSGSAAWLRALAALKARLEFTAKSADKELDEDMATATRLSIQELTEFERFFAALVAEVERFNSAQNWAAIDVAIRTFVLRFFGAQSRLEQLNAELQHLTILDRIKLPVSLELVRAVVQTALRRPLEREGQFQRDEPTVATISEAHGVLFDEVILPGLVEKEFPQAIEFDSLLNDEQRERLNALHPDAALRLRRDVAARERFLFRMTVHSARRRLVLSLPRTDTETGRERQPSSYLLPPARHFDNTVRDFATLDAFLRRHPAARRIPFNALASAGGQFPYSDLQFDLQRVQQALSTHSTGPLGTLLAPDSALRHALRVQRARFLERDFGAFDGLCAEVTGPPDSISASRLETYATCPYQYFATFALKLSAYDEPDAFTAMSAGIKGTLVHHILEQFLKKLREDTQDIFAPEARELLAATAQRAFRGLQHLFSGGTEFLRHYEQAHVSELLQRWLTFERARSDEFGPREFESAFTYRSGPWTVRGRMDRVDRNERGELRIVDYKTGQAVATARVLSLDGGREVQLPLYLLAQRDVAAVIHSAEYLFLSGEKLRTVVMTAADFEKILPTLERLLLSVHGEIAAGHFFPRPAPEACRVCAVRDACGAGRFTPKWRRETAQTNTLRMLGAGGEEA
jgi:RecB family exonuclease